MNDGSHLVLNSSTKVSFIIGDGRSMVHFAPKTTVILGNVMTTHCFVYEQAVFNLTLASVTIGGYLYVKGKLAPRADADIIVSLPATIYLETQDVHISSLLIEKGALMKINSDKNTIFNLTINHLKILGDFTAGPIDFFNITHFAVGVGANVEFDPVDDNEYLGESIEIRGTVTLGHAVSFTRPCSEFILDNAELSWDISTPPNTTIECERVVINGPFSPGNVQFGMGIRQLSVGNNGIFTFTAIGPVYMDSISIAGTVYVNNYADIKSTNDTGDRIKYVIIHSPNGRLYLNYGSQLGYHDNFKDISCSTLNADNVIIDGTFTADNLSVGAGIESLSVKSNGVFTFTPCGDFPIHELYVNGTMTSSIPLALKGTNIEKCHDFTIDTHGTVTLDNDVQSTKAWTGTSQLGVHNVEVYGNFYAGRMENRIASNGSWDSLYVENGAKFYFEPDGPFILDYMVVSGDFRAYGPIDIYTMRPEKDLIIYVTLMGAVRFDALVSSGWTSLSSVTAKTLQTSKNSYFSAGDTQLDVQNLTIGGSFYAYPSRNIKAAAFTVTRTGSANIARTVNIKGRNMNITGTLDLSYQHDPKNATSRCNKSRVTYDHITVGGTFKVGCIHIHAKTLQTLTSSYFSTGDMQLDDLQSLTIGGSFYAYPSRNIKAATFTVTRTGSANMARTVNFTGQDMNITGTLDLSYQHDPKKDTSGCNKSRVDYDHITVGGTFKVGCIHIHANTLQTLTSSYFSTGDMQLDDLQSLTIGGRFYVYPSKNLKAAAFTVTSTGSADISRTVNIDGQDMNIAGKLDVAYQHNPDNKASGCNETRVTYNNISVSGIFRAGSIRIDSHTLTVSGTMDVSGGGYLSDTGPGEFIQHN